jgi:DNA-binding response OmpR family regulator
MLPQRREIASVVVCEDDAPTLDLLCENLTADRFGVLPAPSASDALRLCRFKQPDLMLLDLTLPDASGLDVLQEIREADGIVSRFDPRLPVIVLSGRGADEERVRGLEFGADDYMVKPYVYGELRARMTAVLRRARQLRSGPMRVGEIVVDPARHRAWVGGREVRLSKKEFSLLRVLATDPHRVFSKRELLAEVWGQRAPTKTRTLDSHASRLRRKLDPERARFVINCWGVGYRLLDG